MLKSTEKKAKWPILWGREKREIYKSKEHGTKGSGETRAGVGAPPQCILPNARFYRSRVCKKGLFFCFISRIHSMCLAFQFL